ncbi:Primary amine oxidase, lung isozyme [Seiridium cupressi]
MRSSTCFSSPRALTAIVSALLSFTELVQTLSNPQPKTPSKAEWAHNRGKKIARNAIRHALEKYSVNETTLSPGFDGFEPYAISAPYDNVWGGLSDTEAASVISWLFGQTALNLTKAENATGWDNSIVLVELQVPNKTDVLSHIDANAEAPTRYAHVVLDNRATLDPYFQDLLVGPLPIDNANTTYQPLEYPFTRKIEGKVRNIAADDHRLYPDWLYVVSAQVADITLDLWNGTALGLENDTLTIHGIDPMWQDDGRIVRWDVFSTLPTSQFDSATLLPLGLYVKSDVTGRDPSQWKVEGWLYDDQYFETTETFREAYWSGVLPKLRPNLEGAWASTDPIDTTLPYDSNYPPTTIAPAGPRFGVDHDRKYVEWMGFSFFIGFSRDTGMALYDIKYKGERILYELGLQEALAHYAANDPVQSGIAYLDSYYGFGPYAFELVPEYDCPGYATYLNSTFYVDETTHTHLNSICLFEFTADYPIQRHSTGEYVSATKNTYFSVRSVSTVGNYDYMFTYSFFLDGSITVEVRASGYIQATYSTTGSDDFGFRIQEALSGSMHDHVLNFKADFDILGTANTVQLMKNVPVSRVFPWSNGKARNTMQVERSFIENEAEGRFDWAPNSAQQVLVVNQDQKNQWGEYRGYRVAPVTGGLHLTVENSTNLGNAALWAEYDVQITRQHDYEPRAAHPYASQDLHDPPINFSQFFNDESLEQEDLVIWLNLGMHHVPHTGDLPNSMFTVAHASMVLSPSNYFNTDQSRQTVNQVRINYANGAAADVQTFGQQDVSSDLQFTPIEHDLWQYKGDVVVRKFPYDPNDPYYETDSQ